jgi:hypothetical protein
MVLNLLNHFTVFGLKPIKNWLNLSQIIIWKRTIIDRVYGLGVFKRQTIEPLNHYNLLVEIDPKILNK